MKFYHLSTASDMISEEALKQTSTPLIPGPSIMMVMRSRILKHSVPVAYVERDMAINQDIRAKIDAERKAANKLQRKKQRR